MLLGSNTQDVAIHSLLSGVNRSTDTRIIPITWSLMHDCITVKIVPVAKAMPLSLSAERLRLGDEGRTRRTIRRCHDDL